MGVTKNYSRLKSVTTNSTGIDITIQGREQPDALHGPELVAVAELLDDPPGALGEGGLVLEARAERREVGLDMGIEEVAPDAEQVDRKSTRLNSSHSQQSRMPSSA